jgi:hypothetical protein
MGAAVTLLPSRAAGRSSLSAAESAAVDAQAVPSLCRSLSAALMETVLQGRAVGALDMGSGEA